MTVSMTGFAARRGQGAGASWTWDLRGVNGKGLDLRLRLPDWIEGLEQALRAELTRALARGNVSLSLKVARDAGAEGRVTVNPAALAGALAALREVEGAALAAGLALRTATAAEILAVRGVAETGAEEEGTTPLRAAILADLPALIADFQTSRRAEGAALAAVIRAQIDRIESLTAEARTEAEGRRDQWAANLRDNMARALADIPEPGRLAQELAVLIVKSDVTEELDRLTAHVAAARALVASPDPAGRKLDFLMQEFMREANTLCSKAASTGLTRIGLDLKVTIDQMREQVQNVE